MNIAANPIIEADQTVYLKDYQKPSFLVDSIHLDIQVYDEHSKVDAVLELTRQTEGDLVLLGRDLELKSLVLNGQQLSQEQYVLDTEQSLSFLILLLFIQEILVYRFKLG